MAEKNKPKNPKLNNPVLRTSGTGTSEARTSGTGRRLVVVLVRGGANLNQKVRDTLLLLNLARKNRAVILEDNPVNRGMLHKVQGYTTWGELSDEMFNKLVEQRGQLYKRRITDRKQKYQYNFFTVNGKEYKKYFSLNPPRKGFGRKGVKVAFKAGGALGYRGEKINNLVERML